MQACGLYIHINVHDLLYSLRWYYIVCTVVHIYGITLRTPSRSTPSILRVENEFDVISVCPSFLRCFQLFLCRNETCIP